MALIREDKPFLTIWRAHSDDPAVTQTAYANQVDQVNCFDLAVACGAALGGHLAVYEPQYRTVQHTLYLFEVFSRAMYDAYNQALTEQADKAAEEAV